MWFAAFALGSMAWQAYNQWQEGKRLKAAGESQAQVFEARAQQDEFNASVADAQARDADVRGLQDVARFREQVRGVIGTQRSGYAAQGVVVSNGSAAAVQADATALGEADVRQIQANAQREAWGFRVEANNQRRNAEIDRKGGDIARREGANAQKAARIGAVTTVVGGTSSLLIQRYGWSQPNTSTSTSTPAAAPGPSLTQGDMNYLRRQSPTLGSGRYGRTGGVAYGDALPGYRNAA